jgi:hypothetical protein
MREPGEDDDERGGGEYYQMAIGETAPAPTLGTDLCGCAKPPGCWGSHGFHLKPNPQHPDSLSAAQVYERCPAYSAAVARSGGYQGRGHHRAQGRRRGRR